MLSSRISHEKDPEDGAAGRGDWRAPAASTSWCSILVAAIASSWRWRTSGVPDAAEWVLASPAVHPMEELADYYRAADVLVQGSLEEGLGFSPLEALACEVPDRRHARWAAWPRTSATWPC